MKPAIHLNTHTPFRRASSMLGLAGTLACLLAGPASALGAPKAASAAKAGTNPNATASTASSAATAASSTTPASGPSSTQGNLSSHEYNGAISQTPSIENTYLIYSTNAPLALTINNGLKGLSEEVIPALADPDYRYFGNRYFWDDFAIECLRVDAGIKNSELDAPVTKSTINGSFGNNGKVLVDVDLDAEASTTFFVDVEKAPGFNSCSLLAAVDNVADWFVGLFGGQSTGSQTADDIAFEQLTLSASGLTGEVNVTLGLVGEAVQVTSVDKLTAELGAVNYSGTALAEFLARLADAGINLFYDDIEDFVNTELNDNFIPDQQDRWQTMVNDALLQNLSVDKQIPLGSYNAKVKLKPAALLTSKTDNTLTLDFNFDVTSSAPTASCASNVSFRGSLGGSALRSSADFDLQIPHWTLAKSIYEAARQGLFCTNTVTALSSQPWTVAPNGAITVDNGRSTITTTNASGFPMSQEFHHNELLVTVPLAFAGKVGGYQGSATADLQIYAALRIPAGDRSVYLDITEMEAVNVTGSMRTASGFTVDLSTILDAYLNQAADKLEEEIEKIPLVPKTTTFAEDLGLEISQILINDSHTTVGINIVPLESTEHSGWSMEPFINLNDDPHLDTDDLPPLNDGGIIDRINP